MESTADENYVPSPKISKTDRGACGLENNQSNDLDNASDQSVLDKGTNVNNQLNNNGVKNTPRVRKRPIQSTNDILNSIASKIQSQATATSSTQFNTIQTNKMDELANVEMNAATSISKVTSEKDVGIEEYISDHKGFNGIIKQRYSDFIVNEIDTSNQELRLSDLSLPIESEIVDEAKDDILSPDDLQQLEKLRKSIDSNDGLVSEVSIKVSDIKEEREKMHYAIRRRYPNFISETIMIDYNKYLKVCCKSKQSYERQLWPMNRGDYCHCLMYKQNKDTMEAIGTICKFLNIKPSAISFAGTKDKRGKTTQKISLHRVEAHKLIEFNKRQNNMTVGNFQYCNSELKLGDLMGNHFNIVLRNIDACEELLNESLLTFKTKGFINYYGMQRFGTASVPTHRIGKMILLGKWDKVVELILSPQEDRNDSIYGQQCMQDVRLAWFQTQNPRQAIAKMPSKIRRSYSHAPEICLLDGLIKCGPNDLVGAINHIPRGTRQMYVHAYQSYVWNSLVSRKLKLSGMRAETGDLAFKISDKHVKIKDPTLITDDNISEFTIHDLVFPYPGYDVTYPRNDTRNWISDLLEVDGLTLGDFKNKIKDYSLPGGYRHILTLPTNFKWDVVEYEDATIPLTLSDKEIMSGDSLTDSISDGKYKALKLEFQLPPSSYATMAIREILKIDTTVAHQTTLNT